MKGSGWWAAEYRELHTVEKHIDTMTEAERARQRKAFNLGRCNKWSRKRWSIATWITLKAESRGRLYHVSSSSQHTHTHTLPTAVVSGFHGDQVTTATSGPPRGCGPAPDSMRYQRCSNQRLPWKLPQHQQCSEWRVMRHHGMSKLH